MRRGARQLHVLPPCEKVGAAQDVGTDLHRCDLRQQKEARKVGKYLRVSETVPRATWLGYSSTRYT